MRSSPTPSESRLWAALRRGALGFRFRRQHILAGYIVDFYCPACGLAIEVDGPIHRGRHLEDRERDGDLAALGEAVLRVSNERVLTELPRVLAQIATVATSLAGAARTPRRSDSLPPLAGEGTGKGA
jgi:very-short-patch-repair endonuclease